jgi:hypothetical protein
MTSEMVLGTGEGRGSFPASLEAGDSSRNVGLLRGALRGVK